MSIDVSKLVWKADLKFPAGKTLVLLCYADHAHTDGSEARPGIDTVARETKLQRRQVQHWVRELRNEKYLLIQRDATNKTPTVYRVDVDKLRHAGGVPYDTPKPGLGVSSTTPPGVLPTTPQRPSRGVAEDTLTVRVSEPSENRTVRESARGRRASTFGNSHAASGAWWTTNVDGLDVSWSGALDAALASDGRLNEWEASLVASAQATRERGRPLTVKQATSLRSIYEKVRRPVRGSTAALPGGGDEWEADYQRRVRERHGARAS